MGDKPCPRFHLDSNDSTRQLQQLWMNEWLNERMNEVFEDEGDMETKLVPKTISDIVRVPYVIDF